MKAKHNWTTLAMLAVLVAGVVLVLVLAQSMEVALGLVALAPVILGARKMDIVDANGNGVDDRLEGGSK